jgi:hypothetical protein
MFVCDDCHDTRCPTSFLEDFMRSRGRCEGCGKHAACADCQGYKHLPPLVPNDERMAWCSACDWRCSGTPEQVAEGAVAHGRCPGHAVTETCWTTSNAAGEPS